MASPSIPLRNLSFTTNDMDVFHACIIDRISQLLQLSHDLGTVWLMCTPIEEDFSIAILIAQMLLVEVSCEDVEDKELLFSLFG